EEHGQRVHALRSSVQHRGGRSKRHKSAQKERAHGEDGVSIRHMWGCRVGPGRASATGSVETRNRA
ncbi:hypothetical protein EXIGLDRAFT_727125, partial [Exidia glandulosa HHB12029]